MNVAPATQSFIAPVVGRCAQTETPDDYEDRAFNHSHQKRALRIAFFTDSYNEVNGVARTSRELTQFARNRGLPLLCIHAAEESHYIPQSPENSVATFAMRRSRAAFKVDRDLSFDPLLWRYKERVAALVHDFAADLVHVTSPGDVGQLGAYIAYKLKIPLVASWHTNVHEFGSRRLEKMCRHLPDRLRRPLVSAFERGALRATLRFYRLAHTLLAPNVELIELLERRTRKPTQLMRRGVDAELFSPQKRATCENNILCLGYVGRLTAEKNVRFLARLEQTLRAAGHNRFRFLIVGQGSERSWLERHLQEAEFTGVLTGEELARAYARMDIFLFPSHTDTFGNVIQEAGASGVPVVVTNSGGPKFLVRDGVTGFIAGDDAEFIARTHQLMNDAELRMRMRAAARARAASASWDRVFERVYEAYVSCLSNNDSTRIVERLAAKRAAHAG